MDHCIRRYVIQGELRGDADPYSLQIRSKKVYFRHNTFQISCSDQLGKKIESNINDINTVRHWKVCQIIALLHAIHHNQKNPVELDQLITF